jgi:hypothetical protein
MKIFVNRCLEKSSRVPIAMLCPQLKLQKRISEINVFSLQILIEFSQKIVSKTKKSQTKLNKNVKLEKFK